MNSGQFLGRFQRIQWLQPSVIALVLGNLVPLFALFFFHWDVFSLLFLFWLENVVIGIFNVFKMLLAGVGARDLPPYGWIFFGAIKLFLIPFFCVHYGMFTFVHGMFVVGFFDRGALHNFGGLNYQLILQIIRDNHLEWPFVALVVSHLISFGWDYLWSGAFRRSNPMDLMTQPYRRVIVMHLTVLFGGFLTMALHLPEAALVLLVALKTSTDLWGLQGEREKLTANQNASIDTPTLAPRASLQNVLQQAMQARARQTGEATAAGQAGKKQFIPVISFVVVFYLLVLGFICFVGYQFIRPFISSSRRGFVRQTTTPTSSASPAYPSLWKSELAGVPFPETPAQGRFRGADFSVVHAVYTDGKISLRDGSGTNSRYFVITLNLDTNKLSGASYEFSPNGASGLMNIKMNWHQNGSKKGTFQNFAGGYAMKLQFGDRDQNNLPAKIYLCLPDAQKSCLAGIFNMTIKKEKESSPPSEN